jgi:hypothetical protein
VSNLSAFAKVIFVVAFAAFFGLVARAKNYDMLLILAAIFLGGILIHRWRYFWRVCFWFFGFLSMSNTFLVFGGLEPNTSSMVADSDWISLKFFMVLAVLFSTFLAAAAGLREERRRKSGA